MSIPDHPDGLLAPTISANRYPDPGGRAAARNRRLRLHQARAAQPPPEVEVHQETAHEASLLLDQQFPHLRHAIAPRVTKRQRLPELLRNPAGATLDHIAAAGWYRATASDCFRSALGRRVVVHRGRAPDGTWLYTMAQ